MAGGDGADIGASEAQATPTGATVSISGQVTTVSGRGIVNVRLTLTDSSGQARTATTASLGYYLFDAVQAGEILHSLSRWKTLYVQPTGAGAEYQ